MAHFVKILSTKTNSSAPAVKMQSRHITLPPPYLIVGFKFLN